MQSNTTAGRMMRYYVFLITLLQLTFSQSATAQLDSIYNQNVWRSFITHLPANYNPNNQYPLVVNLHGLNSNAGQQQNYSQFDNIADLQNFIVVYPNAISNSWVINGTSDVNFIAALIDTIRSAYSCNNCLFITGMSQGGFLTYKLACSLPQAVKAVAVVSGNMSYNLQNNCVISGGMPVIHFHGTADSLVNYNGTIGIAPVDTTIQWWINQNSCTMNPVVTSVPNINLADSTFVDEYFYGNGVNGSEVLFYKITEGGHTWPGGSPVPPFGFTNMDINASQLIGNFFSQYCSVTSGASDIPTERLSVFPNPFANKIFIQSDAGIVNIQLFNSLGDLMWEGKDISQQDFSYLEDGIYLVRLLSSSGQRTVELIKE
jgi:polyhydroxybutyrate depolymerase